MMADGPVAVVGEMDSVGGEIWASGFLHEVAACLVEIDGGNAGLQGDGFDRLGVGFELLVSAGVVWGELLEALVGDGGDEDEADGALAAI